MNNDKFVIAKNIKEFIMILDDYLVNYPKRYYELRNKMMNDSYKLLELVYLANYKEVEDRKPIQLEALVRINLIDFYIEESYKRKIISDKQSISISNKLLTINKMLYKWIDDEKC